MLDRLFTVPLHFGFVLHHLPVQLVDQGIDCGIQVMRQAFHIDSFATQTQVDFGLLTFFFLFEVIHGQNHGDIDNLIEMTFHALQLRLYVFTDGWCHFEMMSADGEIHTHS